MKELTINQLEGILNKKIIKRKSIYLSEHVRVIEKLTTEDSMILIKYGDDKGLKNEITMYNKVLSGSQDPVPKSFVCKKIDNDICLLALEWVDGVHPNFRDTNHIKKVFPSLGIWVAEWSVKIEKLQEVSKVELSAFSILNQLLEEHQLRLSNMLGSTLIDLLYQCISYQEVVIQNLQSFPLTLDPGDISLHNIILNAEGKVIFIDFESCSVRPMIMVVEHLGEDYESIPYKKTDIEEALMSYLDAWNSLAQTVITKKKFNQGHLCARIYYKIGDFNYWITSIIEEHHIKETKEWIDRGEQQLYELLKKLENETTHPGGLA
ncbi:hypothetical protein J14TS2_18180 [Bacillus sp. J14TS2]|uniref:hypothetical protein n=1 Tax=Bacillus sp. J14TS2 TaxID=2807188 RepID=UPI001B1E1A4B|nr:hypothetical protein [Bacillus sp. J14TS2]GIN71343.1 hypothetical protein J14TS2_18180 [Bacillus sp. J14TS2]